MRSEFRKRKKTDFVQTGKKRKCNQAKEISEKEMENKSIFSMLF